MGERRLAAWRGAAGGEHLFASSAWWSARPPACSPRSAGSPKSTVIDVGTVLGHVGDTEVRSPFAGIVQDYIAVEGERVTLRQPIAWLRTA
ncbi:MAG: hypothetical protein R2694_15300 [Ilumatobacteraceae bacterium]